MLTFFTTAKPFLGHSNVIQRNALGSWKRLHPDVEIILFGDDEGAGKVAQESGIRHEMHVERDQRGLKRLDYMFSKAQAVARHDLLCYINCDIILTKDFVLALKRVKQAHRQFLMVGRRRDMQINEGCDFEREDWQAQLRARALEKAKVRTPEWIDYFAFSRGLYGADLPPFVVGRVFWDNWLVWKAREEKYPVIDASAVIMAVHQNHDYGYHSQGKDGVFHGEESARNYKLAGGWKHLYTITDATEVLREDSLKLNRLRHWVAGKRHVRQVGRVLHYDALQPIWFFLLGITRPVRSVLGLRAGILHRLRQKV
ncbi:MAG TPA: hypothetical protein VFN26_10965 [Candidatus Acidoferrum sp.]|nr:hypothetical protein [Candidatus Acidoferrum sp.]